jgi:hypothetical protein
MTNKEQFVKWRSTRTLTLSPEHDAWMAACAFKDSEIAELRVKLAAIHAQGFGHVDKEEDV